MDQAEGVPPRGPEASGGAPRAPSQERSRDGSGRPFAAISARPLRLGVLLALLLVAFLWLAAWVSGDLTRRTPDRPWWLDRDARLAVLVSVLAAATLTALRLHAAGTRRDLALVAALGGWRHREIDAALRPGERRREVRAGFAGALFVPLLALLVDRDPGLYFSEGYWFFSKAWTWLLGMATTSAGGVLCYRAVRDARAFSRLAERLPEVDLLEPARLAPFARQAFRAAVPALLVATFVALNAVDQGFAWAIGVVGSISLCGGALSLALPLRGVRSRVERAKGEELARVHAAIRGLPGALVGSPLEARDPPGLADLLAWRAQVAAVPEWPLDPSTLRRYGLFLAIPLASWVGGALVERALDRALG